jgi:hypothetical protein
LPYVIREGLFGATFNKNEELLFLRMELLTEKNAKCWSLFKQMTCWVANQDSRGVLSGLVLGAGEVDYFKYEDIKEVTGFTNEEYITFIEKAVHLKKKTENKIVKILEANSVGSNHMYAGFNPGQLNYIVYISKNRNFSIQDADMTGKEINLKNFIEEEGYIERKGEKIDLTHLEVSADNSEGKMNYIKISALTRIYSQVIGSTTKPI